MSLAHARQTHKMKLGVIWLSRSEVHLQAAATFPPFVWMRSEAIRRWFSRFCVTSPKPAARPKASSENGEHVNDQKKVVHQRLWSRVEQVSHGIKNKDGRTQQQPNVMKCGSLNLLEPSGPHRDCYGTALPWPLHSNGICKSDAESIWYKWKLYYAVWSTEMQQITLRTFTWSGTHLASGGREVCMILTFRRRNFLLNFSTPCM